MKVTYHRAEDGHTMLDRGTRRRHIARNVPLPRMIELLGYPLPVTLSGAEIVAEQSPRISWVVEFGVTDPDPEEDGSLTYWVELQWRASLGGEPEVHIMAAERMGYDAILAISEWLQTAPTPVAKAA